MQLHHNKSEQKSEEFRVCIKDWRLVGGLIVTLLKGDFD